MPDEHEELPARLRRLRANGRLAEARALIESRCAASPGDLHWQMERGTQSLHEGRVSIALIGDSDSGEKDFSTSVCCAKQSFDF